MDPGKNSLNFIFPTKYVIPKSLKFSHWPSKLIPPFQNDGVLRLYMGTFMHFPLQSRLEPTQNGRKNTQLVVERTCLKRNLIVKLDRFLDRFISFPQAEGNTKCPKTYWTSPAIFS